MDVLAAQESLLHMLVIGDVRQHPQLDLAVVGVQEDTAVPGHKHLANLAAQLPAHGNILKVGLSGGQTPGGSDHVLEGGVDAAIVGNDLQKSLGIGGRELGEHPVFENGLHNGMLLFELFQHLGTGGVAGFGLLGGGQPQLFKEDLPQLLGGIDVEFLTGQGIDRVLRRFNPLREHGAKGHQRHAIHRHAYPLHV